MSEDRYEVNPAEAECAELRAKLAMCEESLQHAHEVGNDMVAELEAKLAAEREKVQTLTMLLRHARPHIGDEYQRSWPKDEIFDDMIKNIDKVLAATQTKIPLKHEELPESLKEHPYTGEPNYCFGCGFAHEDSYVDCIWAKEI